MAALARRPARGVASGLVLVLLGIWTGLVHFVGPYFGYQFGTAGVWEFTWDRLWFGILPGVAAIAGGLLLVAARDRVTGSLGAGLGMACGVWLTVALTLAGIWQAAAPGAASMSLAEQVGLFYGLAAALAVLAAFAAAQMAGRPAPH